MSEILCVTNRSLCTENFLDRIEKIARARPAGIILREKDLTAEEYRLLARQVVKICRKYQIPCILHSFTEIAGELSCDAFHGPLHVLRTLSRQQLQQFRTLGASCHSVEEALEAQALGCTYITAGHIFETDCKKGLTGRGLDFLHSVCKSVSIPVYAIGGISSRNFALVRHSGATGACVMSGLMQCENVQNYLRDYERQEIS